MTVSWHESIYELEAGVGLALCYAHAGAHVFYQGGCQALPPGLSRPERVRIARQDRPARPEPLRVELDHAELAQGIAEALHSLIERRREQRARKAQPAAPEATSEQQEQPAEMAGVEVWQDDGASG